MQPAYFQLAKKFSEAPPVAREVPEEPEPIAASVPEPEELTFEELPDSNFSPSSLDNQDPLANFAKEFDDDMYGGKFAELIEDEPFDPQTIPGITVNIAAQLEGKTLDDLLSMSESDWRSLKGIAEAKAGMIMQYLANLTE